MRALEDALDGAGVEVAVGRGAREGVLHELYPVEGRERLDAAQVNGGEGAHAVREPVEKRAGVGEAREERGLLGRARARGSLRAGRQRGGGDARGLCGHGVRGHDRPSRVEDRHVVGVDADEDGAGFHEGRGHGVVGAVDGDVAVLLDGAGFLAGRGKADRGERDETGLLFGEGLIDAAAGGAVDPDVGHGVEPLPALLAESIPGGEGTAGEEVMLEVVEGTLDLAAAFFVSGAADGGLEAIVPGEGEEGGMPARLAPDPAQRDGGLVVIGDAVAEAPVVAEGLAVRRGLLASSSLALPITPLTASSSTTTGT